MKMADVRVGKVYVRGRFRGQHGVTSTGGHVMVDATYVSEIYSSRADRVQVHNVSWDEEQQQWIYTGTGDADGNPLRYLLMARELLTIEEVEARNAEIRAKEEERDRRRKAEHKFTAEVERTIAMRLGVDHHFVNVFAMLDDESFPNGKDEEGNYRFKVRRGDIQGRAITEMMNSDPDAVLIAEIIGDIEPDVLHKMSPEELAGHIVGGLRKEVITEDEETADDPA